MTVRSELGAWLGVLSLFAFALQAGVELDAALYRFGVQLAEGLFGAQGARCDVCGCTREQPCAGGCGWDPNYALQGLARCSRCAGAPRILQPGDQAFAETQAWLHGRFTRRH